jgi:hypothetical protein
MPFIPRKCICKIINDYERVKVAAFIDGEGCITTQIETNKIKIHIDVANTDNRLMDFLIKTLGCGFITSGQTNPGCKTVYHFRIRVQNDVLYFLEQIKDHLLLKKEQAILAIQLLTIRQSHITDEVKEIMMRIKCLNKRGSG